jgi:hypothetical protein
MIRHDTDRDIHYYSGLGIQTKNITFAIQSFSHSTSRAKTLTAITPIGYLFIDSQQIREFTALTGALSLKSLKAAIILLISALFCHSNLIPGASTFATLHVSKPGPTSCKPVKVYIRAVCHFYNKYFLNILLQFKKTSYTLTISASGLSDFRVFTCF